MEGLKVLLLENNSVGSRVANMPSLHSEKEGIRKAGTGRINTIPQRMSLIKKHPVPTVGPGRNFHLACGETRGITSKVAVIYLLWGVSWVPCIWELWEVPLAQCRNPSLINALSVCYDTFKC